MGGTTVSKLMAAKRPHLVPIYDSVVSNALDLSLSDSWSMWQHFMRQDWSALCAKIRETADEVGGDHLSDLRVIDIVVWMTETSGKRATASAKQAPRRKPLVPERGNVDPRNLRNH
jgi:hypothetical protein